jgi:hypothetical protein
MFISGNANIIGYITNTLISIAIPPSINWILLLRVVIIVFEIETKLEATIPLMIKT